jgi:hypothetical protein
MKRAIVLAVLFAFGLNASAKEKKQWVYTDGVIQAVFLIERSAKSTELLRIYDDGTFEHLRYLQKSAGREEVQRNLGMYIRKKNGILFNSPADKSFTGKFRYGSFFYNGKLYNSFFDMKVRKKNEAFSRTDNSQFFKPFFICLNSNKVVSNAEAAQQIDVKRLLDYTLIGKSKDEEKVMAIIQLIVESVEYDFEGLRSETFANNQTDTKSILAGRKRLAVCAGYAHVFAELCTLAGIQAENINGHTKTEFNELSFFGGYHAWNIACVGGERRLYDLTWADNGDKIDMRWIDVDPRVMIGSHFPDNSDHQLLFDPVSKDAFISTSIILPMKASAKFTPISVSSKQFAGSTFRITLPGKHTVSAMIFPEKLTELIYRGEGNSRSGTFSAINVGEGYFDGDSTYFTVPLTAAINPIEIEIDGELKVRTIAYKGGQRDLMSYFISKADRRYSDSYVKGVAAAIRLADESKLRELLGSSSAQFFDKKGKLAIDKKVIKACLDWTGDISALTKMKHSSYTMGDNNEIQAVHSTSIHMDIPGKLRFTLVHDGQLYAVTKIETL